MGGRRSGWTNPCWGEGEKPMSRRMFRPSLSVATLVLAGALTAPARASAGQARAFYAETDPATFALHGYSAHRRVAPAWWPRWTVGAGVYALDLPPPMVELRPSNRDEGWEVRLLGYGVFVDRFLTRDDEGWFAGVQLAAQ